MLCPSCGTNVGDEVRLCDRCQEAQRAFEKSAVKEEHSSTNTPEDGSRPVEQPAPEPEEALKEKPLKPAGFWLRFFANQIDTALLTFVSLLAVHTFFLLSPSALEEEWKGAMERVARAQTSDEALYNLIFSVVGGRWVLSLLMCCFYHVVMEASPFQGSIGKIIFRFRVTDELGNRPGWLRVLFRNLAFYILFFTPLVVVKLGRLITGSPLGILTYRGLALTFFILFVLAMILPFAITSAKRGVHDIISGCLVIRQPEMSLSYYMLFAIVGFVMHGLLYYASASLFPVPEDWDFAPKVNVQATGRDNLPVPPLPEHDISKPKPVEELKVYDPQVVSPPVSELSTAAPPTVTSTTTALSVSEPEEVTAVVKEPPKNPFAAIEQRMSASGMGRFGYAASGESEVTFADQIVIYYPKYLRIEVGFYIDSLSAATRQEIVRSGQMALSHNRSRPSVIVSLPLTSEKGELAPSNLMEYTVHFYREFGAFEFLGFDPQVSFTRSAKRVQEGEVPTLSGNLVSGGTIEGVVRGRQTDRGTNAPFEWGLRIHGPIFIAP